MAINCARAQVTPLTYNNNYVTSTECTTVGIELDNK